MLVYVFVFCNLDIFNIRLDLLSILMCSSTFMEILHVALVETHSLKYMHLGHISFIDSITYSRT